MSLVTYKKKRNFKNTPEPVSGKAKKTKALSFVIQRHDASRLHYDFRLEMDGVLKSWAVPKGPSMVAGERRLAVMVEDHPFDYGKFYGKIPEGNYGAGDVEIWDRGTYKPLKPDVKNEEAELLKELEKGDLKFVMKGHYLNGAFALVRMNDGEGKNWLLIKKKDEHALKSYDIEKIAPLKSKVRNKNTTAAPQSKNRNAPKKVTEKPEAVKPAKPGKPSKEASKKKR